jgi:sirohydrochlorin cobaltochelatase
MRKTISDHLQSWLEAGLERIGQISIQRSGGIFQLFHHEDRESISLPLFTRASDAIEIARLDDTGQFRPLKSAPNLRHGWRMELKSVAELRDALDYFYPAMCGIFIAHQENRLRIVHLRDTLSRQSGMYAVTKKISAVEADELIGRFCPSEGKCLKTILWKIESERPVTTLPDTKFNPAADQLQLPGRTIPLLCNEACNLLVAEARAVVKKSA